MIVAEKKCFRCRQEKPLAEFYAHPRMADGHLGKCKACTRAAMKRCRRVNRSEWRDRDRRRYYGDADRREATIANAARSKARNPERTRASAAVCHAVRDGRLTRLPCEVCGAAETQGHHGDYSQPLSVRWLCRDHHEELHHPMEVAF